MQTVIEVKRIDLWTLFKVSFFVYAILGLIGGFFYLFFMMIATGIGGALVEEELPSFGLLGGALGIILMPILAFLYGAVGSVMATICAAIINLIMKGTGGVRFDVDVAQVGGFVQTTAPPPSQPTPTTAAPPTAGPAPQAPGDPGPGAPPIDPDRPGP
jgi:hypothetical protein